jgi:hypothetical protein
MEMRCPFCDETGGLMAIHRHLVEAHLDAVTTQEGEKEGQMYYLVPCPFCGLKYRHRLKPRNRNPRFVEMFKAEIAMVAFDQLLYHVLQMHPAEVGVDAGDLQIPTDDGEHGDL